MQCLSFSKHTPLLVKLWLLLVDFCLGQVGTVFVPHQYVAYAILNLEMIILFDADDILLLVAVTCEE